MNYSKKSLKYVISFVGLAAIVVGVVIWPERSPPQPYKSFVSPNSRFKIDIAVHETLAERFLPVAPGQGGDIPGIVYLVDIKKDRVLKKMHIALVTEVTEVEWSETNVSVGFVVDWALPKN